MNPEISDALAKRAALIERAKVAKRTKRTVYLDRLQRFTTELLRADFAERKRAADVRMAAE